MTPTPSAAERLQAGDVVHVSELVDRLDELENIFDDRGFLYIAINGWLLHNLESDQEARELMYLRAIQDHLHKLPGEAMTFVTREDDDAGTFVGELRDRYVPVDGYLYVVPSPVSGIAP